MRAKYNVIAKSNPLHREVAPKFYPSIVTNGRITERELAEAIAENSTLTTVDVMAVLEAFLKIIPRLMTEGYIVELGDFGSFRLRIQTEGETDSESVTAKNITAVLPRFTAGKEFRKVLNNTTFEKAKS